MFKLIFTHTVIACAAAVLASCGGGSTLSTPGPVNTDITDGTDPFASSWPAGLPVDAAQPWEELSPEGYVLPARDTHSTSSINGTSDFTPGVQRFDEGGLVADEGEASRLTSGPAGSDAVSYAIYRIPMVGVQPGVIAADVNLRPMNDASPSTYWLGLSNYTTGAWDWRGPFADAHVRVQPGTDNFLSGLGNTFVAVIAHSGADFDIVGLGLNEINPADSTPPDAPVMDTVIPVAEGLRIEWLHPGNPDLAGFKVYYSGSSFADGSSPGVSEVPYLVGEHRYLLSGISGIRYVRVAAVDISGNESPVSDIDSGTPLAGTAPYVRLVTDAISGLIGDSMNLTATGADVYDWDLDGDGVFEVTADAAGLQSVTPGAVGIIRPAVRGSSGGGTAIGFGAISLLLGTNARPIAQGFADPASGMAPLAVTFTSLSSDFDGTIVRWGWDFDGDKTYDYTTMDPLLINPPPHAYVEPGVYNAKFRVWDDLGAWDVDTVAIHVTSFTGFDWVLPDTSGLTGDYASSAVVDGRPAMVYFDNLPLNLAYVRANDRNGITWGKQQIIDVNVGSGAYNSLAVVAGNPAISYLDAVTNEIYFLRSDDAQGISWTAPRVLLEAVGTSYATSMAIINGNPAVTYFSNATGNQQYIRADSADGSTWGNPPISIDSSGFVGGRGDLKVIDGNPAVAYYHSGSGKAYYIRAANTTGDIIADWPDPPVDVSGAATCSDYVSLVEANGAPAIAYYDAAANAYVYHRALNSTGQTGLDWPGGNVQIDFSGSAGMYSDMAIIDGRPAVCYEKFIGFTAYNYVRANNAEGTQWPSAMLAFDQPSWSGFRYPTLLEIDRAPAIGAYFNGFPTPIFLFPTFQ